jgi:drug/metabolite transporter (DMT)-like permease
VTNLVLLAVLFAALMHAVWNSLISHAKDKGLFTLALHICSAVLAVPLLYVAGLPAPSSYPYLLASILLHGLYIFVLARVYANIAFGPAYIMMRGIAPVFVTLISLLVLGESFSIASSLGLIFLTLGILYLMYSYHANVTQSLKWSQVKFAIINAAVIAAYTVVDGAGARLSGNPVAYVLAAAVFEPILVYLLAYRSQTRELFRFSSANIGMILLGSVISIAGYSIVLWAMTMSPIALVAALRETSVVFAMLISIFWFKEGRFKPAALSCLLVLLGIFFLKV